MSLSEVSLIAYVVEMRGLLKKGIPEGGLVSHCIITDKVGPCGGHGFLP